MGTNSTLPGAIWGGEHLKGLVGGLQAGAIVAIAPPPRLLWAPSVLPWLGSDIQARIMYLLIVSMLAGSIRLVEAGCNGRSNNFIVVFYCDQADYDGNNCAKCLTKVQPIFTATIVIFFVGLNALIVY